ncbi:MAG TPA: hypothetical protein VJY62_06275 [Bacteroidia bacterium]|nr:hypothetical protein [Bacteroidia bacterium]
MVKKYFLLLIGMFIFGRTNSQDVFQHISNSNIYEFLDELANQHIFTLNTAIKPYSRHLIADKLNEAETKKDKLSKNQQKQLDFFLRDYNKELKTENRTNYLFWGSEGYKKRVDLFYFKDSLFTLSINPVFGYEYWKNENGNAYHRWEGAEAIAYIGPHVGIYASLRDNHEDHVLELPSFLTQRPAAVYKGPAIVGGDYSEARGGIVYSWKWGHLGLIKDHFTWGNNYNGANIFSGKTPSFAHIKLNMKPVSWLDFNYVHGFLVSDVLDTGRHYAAGGAERQVLVPKFLAANMFTITPLKKLNFSFGNSIVYSDEFQLAYLIPVYFFKSVDHTTTNTGGNFLGQNAQFYFDISSRQIKYVHLYISFFVDEVSIKNLSDEKNQSNFFSGKIGIAINPPFVPNTTFIAEYTRTNPIVYRHFVNTTTFESNGFNMGHYLRDNAEEIFLGIRCRPIPRLYVNASMTMAKVGESYIYTGQNGTGKGLPFLADTKWKNNVMSFKARFEVINDGFVFAGVDYGKITGDSAYVAAYTPALFRGKTTTVNVGVNFGF